MLFKNLLEYVGKQGAIREDACVALLISLKFYVKMFNRKGVYLEKLQEILGKVSRLCQTTKSDEILAAGLTFINLVMTRGFDV